MTKAGRWAGSWLTAALLAASVSAGAANCAVVTQHVAGPAEAAYLGAEFDKAAGLYRDALKGKPEDEGARAGLVRVLLRQEKVAEAAQVVGEGLEKAPGSAVLLTARAEVELREGEPWVAVQSANAASRLDVCLPRLHLVLSELAGLSSLYMAEKREIEMAHRLDPWDADIRGAWIWTLPLRQRVEELKTFLAGPTGSDTETRVHEELALDEMKKRLAEPHPPCRLVSTATETQIPFLRLMYDATHTNSFGLDVKLNDHRASLEIDTGAGGILVSRGVARSAGLKPFADAEIGGIGDEASGKGYRAFAASIKIGDLEFQNCMVEVMGSKNPIEIDGLIGMDVFSHFLVTLDYPGRKLALGKLPPRPGEGEAAPQLGTREDDEEDGAKLQGEAKAAGAEAAPAPVIAAPKGPFDRYVSPEMKDYTPVYRRGHMLMLPVGLSESKVKLFILDTGAWATSISPAAAREVTKVHGDDSLHVTGLNGEVKKAYMADEVTFIFAHVSQKIQWVPSFDTSRLSKDLGLEVSGFLGARTLELTTIHIDYRDGLVKFDYDAKRVPMMR